jgi:hypothetical protein
MVLPITFINEKYFVILENEGFLQVEAHKQRGQNLEKSN